MGKAAGDDKKCSFHHLAICPFAHFFKEEFIVRILIAEDDFTSRTLLAAVLKKNGYEVLETADGTEAWQELQQPDAPKLAILDWMMPGLDGLEVVSRVRAMQSPQPPYLIILTTRDEKADIVAGLNAGADDYLTKPFDIGELRARVEVGKRMLELQARLVTKIEELRLAMEEIKTLRGIVPICANCKKVRTDAGYWQQVEVYVSEHTEAQFSHGICPACMQELYPDFYEAGEEESCPRKQTG